MTSLIQIIKEVRSLHTRIYDLCLVLCILSIPLFVLSSNVPIYLQIPYSILAVGLVCVWMLFTGVNLLGCLLYQEDEPVYNNRGRIIE